MKKPIDKIIEFLSRLEVEEALVHRQTMKRHDLAGIKAGKGDTEGLVHRQTMKRHDLVESQLRKQHHVKLDQRLQQFHPADIADILESLPLKRRKLLWNRMDSTIKGPVLLEVSDAVRMTLISEMPNEILAGSTEKLDTDEIADLAPDLPNKVMQKILRSLNDQKRKRLQALLAFPENTAGALMDFGMLTIRSDVSLKAIARYIRKTEKLPDHTDKLFVVDTNKVLCGILPLRILLTSRLENQVFDVMVSKVVCFTVTDTDRHQQADQPINTVVTTRQADFSDSTEKRV